MRYGILTLLLLSLAHPIASQQVRVRATTSARYIQLRPVVRDTAGVYRADSIRAAAPFTADLELSAWGFGVQGLRAYALARGRASLGSELLWPRSSDHFDALQAFLELERHRFRIRVGRQQRASGLGLYSFDGLTATARPLPAFRLEMWGGRGLARGIAEPYGSAAIRDLDPLRPDRGTMLLGASAWAAPGRAASVSAVWQREILSDRSGLVSDRAALDAQVGIGNSVILSGSLDADLARESWGKSRLAAMIRLLDRGWVELEVFRYSPVLDLTTIWGAFSPESHRGSAAALHWSPARTLSLRAAVTVRWYESESRTSPFLELDDRTTQFSAGTTVRAGAWTFDGGWRLTTGYGGALSSGDVSVGWTGPDRWRIAARGSAFQEEAAFRVADGTVYGAGVEARGEVRPDLYLRADLMRFWHRRQQGTAGADWSQTRAAVVMEYAFGASADRTEGGRQ